MSRRRDRRYQQRTEESESIKSLMTRKRPSPYGKYSVIKKSRKYHTANIVLATVLSNSALKRLLGGGTTTIGPNPQNQEAELQNQETK